SQAVQGADQVEIIEVIDHHRIGSFSTPQPILFRNEPVGSTSTIVADCFFRYGVELPPSIAGLLLAWLVSDTLNLTSPTTTQRDAQILAELEKRAGVDAADFTEKLFSSGSVLVSKSVDQAITVDCKEYVEAGQRFSVAQIEEIGFGNFRKRQGAIQDALDAYRADNGYLFSALLVTDVVLQTSLLLVAGPRKFVDSIQHTEVSPGIFEMPGVVSRKKQLLPFLTHHLARVAPMLNGGN
ncbi:MAG TPA: DHHA2 domain-containing protein, partial [Candidatus Limnocylindria bacterium]|nr:DHHA2 domain-containing protein [Candidatus Limnocylindria bacterium]